MRTALSLYLGSVLFWSILGGSQATESQDLWAEALVLASSTSKVDMKKAEQSFKKALQKADHKAPIYVSLGDYYASTVTIRLLHEQLKAEENTDKEDMITEPESKALKCYIAAAKDDAKYSVAWFRIYRHPKATQQMKEKTLAQLTFVEPENGLPYYLEANAHLQRKNVVQALKSLRLGNQKSFSIPSSPFPKKSSIKYPPSPDFEKAGVVGKPVSTATIGSIARGIDLSINLGLRSYLRGLGRKIVEEARRLQKEGKIKEAIEHSQAVFDFGLRMVQNSSKNGVDILVGFAIVEIASKELRTLYSDSGKVDYVKRLDLYQSSQDTFNRQYKNFLKVSMKEISDSGADQLINADKISEKEKQFLTELLKKTGLDDFAREE